MRVEGVLVLFVLWNIFLPLCLAEGLENSERVSYLHAEVVRTGYVVLKPKTDIYLVKELWVTLSIPQNTTRQQSNIKLVDGPDEYNITKDEWGNDMINLVWKNPKVNQEIRYTLVSDVEVFDKSLPRTSVSFITTEKTRANKEIAEKAIDVASGFSGIEKIFQVADFVHRWLRYDDYAKKITESAQWAFQNRIGACDEFSNLMIAMLSVLGFNAHYVVGYAYGENWGQHGWVEVNYKNETITIDPTWLESPVDATHIKIANLPDSNFTENVRVIGTEMDILWEKGEPEIRVLNYSESSRINITTRLIPTNVSGREHALLSINVKGIYHPCILTGATLKGCRDNYGREFLKLSKQNLTFAFCNEKTYYVFIETPDIENNRIYTCPVLIYGSWGEKTQDVIVSYTRRPNVDFSFSMRDVFLPGEKILIETEVTNHERNEANISLYLFLNDLMQKKNVVLQPGQKITLWWNTVSPKSPGDYDILMFSSLGNLKKKTITVISERKMKITNVTLEVNESIVLVKVSVRSESTSQATINLKIENKTYSKEFVLEANTTKNLLFYHNVSEPGNKEISIVLLSKDLYQDGWFGSVFVEEKRTFIKEVNDIFREIYTWLLNFIEGLKMLLGW